MTTITNAQESNAIQLNLALAAARNLSGFMIEHLLTEEESAAMAYRVVHGAELRIEIVLMNGPPSARLMLRPHVSHGPEIEIAKITGGLS